MIEISVLPERPQTTGEEIANSVSHGVGLLGALTAAPVLIVHTVRYHTSTDVVGASVFAATMILLYVASTLYHALPRNRAKAVIRVIEHNGIYLLIAGTYTPFTLGVLRGPWGWTLFGLAWAFAVIGVTLKSLVGFNRPIFSTFLYLAMGWMVIIAIRPVWLAMSPTGFLLLLLGGLAYTGGIAFYAVDSRLRYGHFIWHLFVMAGTTLHFFAILWYAASKTCR